MPQSNNIQLLITNSTNVPICVYHRAIAYDYNGKKKVIHNTYGGIEIIDFDNFCRERHIYRTKHYPLLKPLNTRQIVEQHAAPFHPVTNNCEDLTSEILNEYTPHHCLCRSPQRLFWITITILATIILTYKLTHK